jgi:hypothetical protein
MFVIYALTYHVKDSVIRLLPKEVIDFSSKTDCRKCYIYSVNDDSSDDECSDQNIPILPEECICQHCK